jgi:CRISPR-associated protein Cas4
MSKIKSEEIWIKISMLTQQAWCELQLYKEVIEGQKRRETKDMKIGTEQHDDKYEEFLEVSVPTTPEEFFGQRIGLSREWMVRSEELKAVGIIDELKLDGNNIIITDDKKKAYPHWGYKKQLYGYALLLKLCYGNLLNDRDIMVALRETQSGQVTWTQKFDEDNEKEAMESIQRIKDMFAGKREPEPTSKSWKCKTCPFKCEKRLAPYEKQ